jgi:Hemingway/CFA97
MIFFNQNPSEWRDWRKSQEKHRNNIKKIYSSTSVRIDNRLPEVLKKAPISKLSTTSVYGSASNIREIDRKNAQILDKLTKMARLPVVLKTLPLAENKVNKRKYFLKKLENNKIHHENIQLVKRLVKTTGSVNFIKFQKDFENSKKYSQLRQKFKYLN